MNLTDINLLLVLIRRMAALVRRALVEACTVPGRIAVLDRMHRICVVIWENGEWPEEWTLSTFIPLPKKGNLKHCENYRTIALVSRASKILLLIILERIRVKTETEIADEQAGFRQGRGTIDTRSRI